MKRRTRIGLVVVVLLIAAGLALVFRPAPVSVEMMTVQRGKLQEIVEDEGKTRMHDRFVVAATVSGKLRRIDLDAGDRVSAGQTVAWIDPAPIDPRQKAVLEARLRAARASQSQADAVVGRTKADFAQTEEDLRRGRELFRQGIISKEALDRVTTLHAAAEKQLQASRSAAESAAYQTEEAQSELLVYETGHSELPTAIPSPVDGRVLRLIEQSERVVSPGTPMLEIGYSPRLEVVADFLTRDAVRMRPGMPALITDWGGGSPIPARVRTVEPGAFTKISALGVEEQRVNVLCDFAGETDGLEDAYHVEVQVILWEGDNVLRVPSSAIFRSSGEWAVFVVRDRRARRTAVQIGHRGEEDWEVLSGVVPGDSVIVHPSSDVSDGVRVKPATRR